MYFLFLSKKISKFSSVRQFHFPLVTSPPEENTPSTGAVEAGVAKMSQATVDNDGNCSFSLTSNQN